MPLVPQKTPWKEWEVRNWVPKATVGGPRLNWAAPVAGSAGEGGENH
jgi:hypothetical protein